MEWLHIGGAVSLLSVWVWAVVAVLALLSGGRRGEEEEFASSDAVEPERAGSVQKSVVRGGAVVD